MHSRTNRLLMASIGIYSAAFTAPSRGDTEDTRLDEVVVTAQRRAEKLQDVPIAVTALNQEQLEQRGISNIGALNAIAPNVQISTATSNTTGAQFSIRGAITINPTPSWDPTVGIYIDGVYIPKMLGGVFDIIDLAQIEVLRGPQGTLYGRNTLAGAVNLTTRKPSGVFGGNADVSYGNYNEVTAKAVLDLPAFGIAKLALGGRYQSRDGITKTTPGSSVKSLDNRDQLGGRLALDLDFTDALTAAYRFDYSDIDQRPLHSYLYRSETGTPLDSYVTHSPDSTVSIDGPTFEKSRVEGHAVTLDWDLSSEFKLKSISAYRKLKWDDSLDLDGSPLPIAHTQRHVNMHNASQELQAQGSLPQLNYVAGLYYYEDRGSMNNPQTYFFGTFNFDSRYTFDTKAYAAYGQVDWRVTDALTLTGGLRYTSERKGITRDLGVNFAPGTPFIPLMEPGTAASERFSATTPVVTVAYRLTPDVNTYLKYSEGFKSGGFNGEFGDAGDINGFGSPTVIAANSAETRRPYQPEKDRTVELGIKTSFDDGRLIINGDVFYNKIKNQQIAIFTASGAASSVVRNAGKATVYGVELETSWRPIDALLLQLNYGYLHSKYDEFIDNNGGNVAFNRAFVHAPKNTANAMIEARMVQTAAGNLFVNLDYSWTDKFYLYPYPINANVPGDPSSNPATASFAGDTQIKSIGLLNGRLSWRDFDVNGMHFEFALWGRNLTDKRQVANSIDFGPGFGHLTQAYYTEPRTYGVQARMRW